MYALPLVRFADPPGAGIGFMPVESPLSSRQFHSNMISAEADADEMLVDYIFDTARSVV